MQITSRVRDPSLKVLVAACAATFAVWVAYALIPLPLTPRQIAIICTLAWIALFFLALVVIMSSEERK